PAVGRSESCSSMYSSGAVRRESTMRDGAPGRPFQGSCASSRERTSFKMYTRGDASGNCLTNVRRPLKKHHWSLAGSITTRNSARSREIMNWLDSINQSSANPSRDDQDLAKQQIA